MDYLLDDEERANRNAFWKTLQGYVPGDCVFTYFDPDEKFGELLQLDERLEGRLVEIVENDYFVVNIQRHNEKQIINTLIELLLIYQKDHPDCYVFAGRLILGF